MSDDIDDRILESLEDRERADTAYEQLLERVGEHAVEPRLDATRRAVELLGDPQRAARVVHITGTNGKGSTARMVEALLRAHGLRTGLLTSPHIQRVNERILIDGEPVTDEAFARNWEEISPFLELVDAELEARGERRLTYFEAMTVLAFAIFADAPVDVQVLEVGMGGAWDSTNVADADVAVFTPIALDHTNRLGATVSAIAHEKAGIIKPGSIVVSATQTGDALAEIVGRAAQFGDTVYLEERDFAVAAQQVAVAGQVLQLRGLAASFDDLNLPLMGRHQGRNAALALATVEAFLGAGEHALSAEPVADGFAAATSQGRLEVVGVDPLVIVDAAHNPHGAAALAAALPEWFTFSHLTLVIGLLEGKDARGVLAALAPLADEIIVTQSGSERAMDADELAAIAAEIVPPEQLVVERSMQAALAQAREGAAERGGAVLVTGSITLLGEVFQSATAEGWRSR